MNREEFLNLGIGESFRLGYRKFTVVESDEDNGCEGCFFDEGYGACIEMEIKKFIPKCSKHSRKDRKNVIFVEVEK